MSVFVCFHVIFACFPTVPQCIIWSWLVTCCVRCCSSHTSHPVQFVTQHIYENVAWVKWRAKIKVDICLCAGILFSTLVFGPACGFILGSLCTKFYVDAIFIDTSEFKMSLLFFACVSLCLQSVDLCISPGKLGITPDDPRWIGAWWAGFLLCGALLFCSALLMFGFPHSLPTKEKEEVTESERAMLPAPLCSETLNASNGIPSSHEPANSPTCCQQLRGECARVSACSGSVSQRKRTFFHLCMADLPN